MSMKHKSGYVLREIGGVHYAIAVGAAAAEQPGMIRLNETGAFLWSLLDRETPVAELAAALAGHASIELAQAATDASDFTERLKGAGLLD